MAQENRPISSPQTALVSAQRDDLREPATDTLPPVETPLETPLETVSAGISALSRTISATSPPRLRQTPFRRRLPRFVRAKRSHRPPLALQDRDLEILRTVHGYRLISTPQVLRLFEDESRDGIYRRLQKLFHHGYVNRIGTNPNAPLVYTLGGRGADVLEVSLPKEVGERYLQHQLMIGNFRIALELSAKVSGIILMWRSVPPESPIKPDGFFSLQFPELPEGRNRMFFCLEADRSTMTGERFVKKLQAYLDWTDRGGHTAALGIKSFRVLTVTKSDERTRSLVDRVIGAPGLRAALRRFWFTPERSFAADPLSVFAPIWRTAETPELRQTMLPRTVLPGGRES